MNAAIAAKPREVRLGFFAFGLHWLGDVPGTFVAVVAQVMLYRMFSRILAKFIRGFMLLRRVGIFGALILLAGCAPVRHKPVVISPAVIGRAPIHYPILAIREAHEGTVVVLVLLNAKGQNMDMMIDKSSGYLELDRAAMACLRGWTFTPEMVDGVPTEAYIRVPISFDFGAQRKKIQLNAANHSVQYFPNYATPPSSQP